MTEPLVSVVLPVFNGGEKLDTALQSLLRQTHERLEIIALDDGSTDDTLQRLHRAQRADSRIVVVSRENKGLIATLNEGLDLTQGDLIARMDADDIAYPERIARQVATFRENPGLAACGTGIHALSKGRLNRSRDDAIFETGDLRILSLFFTLFIHPTAMFDRRVVGAALRYDPAYPLAEDFDLFRRITARHPVKMINTPLLAYRLHEDSMSTRHKAAMRATHLRIVAENLGTDGFTGDLDALNAVAACANEETVSRVANLWRSLQQQISAREPVKLPSYQVGHVNLFHYLYGYLLDLGDPVLVRLLVRTSRAARWVRRREQLMLQLSESLPHLAAASLRASNGFENLIARLRSLPASSVLGDLAGP